MILYLEREYWPCGTNGTIKIDEFKLCHTIEWPWNRNEPDSCIPEGIYPLQKHYDEELQLHLLLFDVPGRGKVKILPSCNLEQEKPGSIIPVSRLRGEGQGSQSRLAFEKFKELVFSVFESKEDVLLEIRSNPSNALNLAKLEQRWMV
ncbi:DUF5675 family protein [Belliella pelovolcani]|uniref:DUF5675 domain-containing protein n=1 Tax=Belliella pelovolcani TaxID=529505 RepID=A0A1N7Q481_9BACT|nr:DUF5675 family protein [Belliella pelovolcani]SIT17509.1 hypothetical protein SAMN05421761_1285 [Belliella pelovolcani]